jgi:hypothetical protein
MRRTLGALCVAGLLLVAGPSSALGWGNGPTRNGFGTHDWILHHAIQLAGADASWVDTETALLASDDPDVWRDSYADTSVAYRLEQPRHLYYIGSAKQGGPQAVADHYALMVAAISADDTMTANLELGVLSHYYADVLSPFHTLSYGSGSLEDGRDHYRYEAAVSAVTQSPDAHGEWISPLAPRPMTDVRARAVQAALYSRSKTLDLITQYGDFVSYDPAGDIQTHALLNRAANDLADLIRSGRTGSGMPRPIATVSAWADYYYPALGRPARVSAKVRDDRGNEVRGVMVSYEFRTAQPCTYVDYTDANGASSQIHQDILGTLRVPFEVVVTAASAGTTLTSTLLLKPTEIIGAGSSGVRTYTKYDATPAQGTTATVMTHVQNGAGRPIPGVKVIYKFRHSGGVVKRTAYTNLGGNAWCSRNIGSWRAGRRVYVQADAYGGTQPQNTYDGIRSASTSFVPHSRVATIKVRRATRTQPSVSELATVMVRCLDDHGRPIVGRTVKLSWKRKSGTTSSHVRTNSSGEVRVSRRMTKSDVGFRIRVTAAIQSGSKTKKSAVSFGPVSR